MTLIFWIAFACLVGALADHKGRSFWGWTFLSFMISPLLAGIILAIVELLK